MFGNYQVNPTAIFVSILYPCFLSKLIRRFMGDAQQDCLYEGSEVPYCSDTVDAVVFNPDVFEDSRTILVSPEAYSLPFEIVWIKTKDGVDLMGYMILQEGLDYTVVPTIIFFHGNSGNIGDRLMCVRKLYTHTKMNILMVEYRGFGFSQGHPSEQGVYWDAQAAFEYVDDRPDLDSSQIVIFGKSLGGAVAIDLASRPEYKDRIGVLVVENTFATLTELAHRILPGFLVPLIKLMRVSQKFASYKKMSEIARPTLFISGQEDTLIPPVHMTKLYVACKARKKIVRFYQGDHMNTWTIPGYTHMFKGFVYDALKKYPVHVMKITSQLQCTDDI